MAVQRQRQHVAVDDQVTDHRESRVPRPLEEYGLAVHLKLMKQGGELHAAGNLLVDACQPAAFFERGEVASEIAAHAGRGRTILPRGSPASLPSSIMTCP